MADQEARMTRTLMTQLDSEFQYLDETLARLDFDATKAAEYRIFCDTRSAVELFGFPAKSDYKGIKIIMVMEFPDRVCQVINSLDFLDA